MRRVVKWLAATLGAVLLAVVLLAAGLFIATLGTAPPPATVTDDPDLPQRDVDGIRLHVQAFGPEDAPVLVVLHGGPGADHRSLLPLQALADRWRVVFYDQRGAGLSERVPAAALTLPAHIAELDALLAQLSPDAPAILIGHSWGAILATAYLGAHPSRVAKAVLIEPGFLTWDGYTAWMDDANAVIEGMTGSLSGLWLVARTGAEVLHMGGIDDAARGDHFAGRMVHAFANDPKVPYACPGDAYDSPSWRMGALASRAVAASATEAQIDAIGIGAARFPGPVLLMAGACDDWIGADWQRQHLPLFADARLSVIDEAGHDVIDDRPAQALAEIAAFLTR